MKRLVNVRIYTEERQFVPGEIRIEGEQIEQVILNSEAGARSIACAAEAVSGAENIAYAEVAAPVEADSSCEVIDGQGCYAIPGLIDMHFHGCMGHDFCDGTEEAIAAIAEYELKQGVTSIAPATMTLPMDELKPILRTAAAYAENEQTKTTGNAGAWEAGTYKTENADASAHRKQVRASFVGINMEGPFISASKCGAQDPKYIQKPSAVLAEELLCAGGGLVKVLGIAPEEEGATEFVEILSKQVTISVAHSNANYDEAAKAFYSGAEHAVHLFNAMSAFHHRDPGIVGAAAENKKVTAELICDGIHLHPAMVRAMFRLFGAERLILVSDSMRATGLADGTYTLGGQEVTVCGKRATLVKDGSLAGSVTTLPDCVRTAVLEMGIPLADVLSCVTANPAKRLGIAERVGSIAPGKQADIVLWDDELNLQGVIKAGQMIG